jgi:hypothetical protein
MSSLASECSKNCGLPDEQFDNVIWYRGGVEAWQVNELPETDLALQDW